MKSNVLKAITEGQTEVVKSFLSKGGDINQSDDDDNTPLLIAARHEQIAIAQLLIECHADIQAVNNEGQTAWSWAAVTGNIELIELLLHYGIDPNTRMKDEDGIGCTALLLASYKGNRQLVRFLVEYGADIHASDDDGETALILASLKGYLDIVVYLLNQGADIYTTDTHHYTALTHAVDEGHDEIVRHLIENGADVRRTCYGWPLLTWATSKGSSETVKVLIENGAEINAEVEEGEWKGFTPLMMASYHGATDLIHLLIDSGADLEATSSNGWTALMLAASQGHLETLVYLLEQGANIHARNVEHQTALLIAVCWGQQEIIHHLLDNSASVDTRDRQYSALMWAVKHGFIETVKILIERGANIHTTAEGSWKGYTALMLAVLEGHTNIVRVLIDRGANVNTTNDKDESTLMWATAKGYLDIVEILMEHGADLDARDREGRTALAVARLQAQEEIFKVLIEKGRQETHCCKTPPWQRIQGKFHRFSTTVTLTTKALYKMAAGKGTPSVQLPQKSQLQQADLVGTLKLLWSYEIPGAISLEYGNWERYGTLNILVADRHKQLHVLAIDGTVADRLTLPAQFRSIQCGRHQTNGTRMLGISMRRTKTYVIDTHGNILWRYSKWMRGISQASWGDINGDGNDEIVLSELGNIMAFTEKGELLWKVFGIKFWNHAIIPHSAEQRSLVLVTKVNGTINVYEHGGKLFRSLRPKGDYLFFGNIAGSVFKSSGSIQMVAVGVKGQGDEVVAFDLAGNVAWKTCAYRPALFQAPFFVCEDINGNGDREWIFLEHPGELVCVSCQGEKVATLSVPEALERVIVVPDGDGYGTLVTLHTGMIKAYQCEKKA